ncbi:MAG: arginine--tRNA ligase, partial [Flavobacteriales bacterium]
MRIEELLSEKASKALKQLYNTDIPDTQIQVQETKKDFEGDKTIVVFPFLKHSKKNPEQTARELGNIMIEEENVKDFNVVKGFLNLKISDKYWINYLNSLVDEEKTDIPITDDPKTIIVEYSSPNTNKPLHLGHLRNNFLGYSLSTILKENGHNVKKVQIINDRGIHICKSMVAWKKFGQGQTPDSLGIKGDKWVGDLYVKFDEKNKEQANELIKQGMNKEEAKEKTELMKEAREMLINWENGDKETVDLWEKMNNWVYEGFDATYERMGVDFDKLYYESQTYLKGREVVLRSLEKESSPFYKKEDGSIWCDLKEDGWDDKLLLRKDGTAVYMTQDIGTAILRYEDEPDLNQLIYTVGNEQDHHFKVLFTILEKLGYEWAKNCYHLSYGMVDLPTGKMKSREGTVIDADDMLDEMYQKAKDQTENSDKIKELLEEETEQLNEMIGKAALKYFLLKVDAKKNITFNPEESVDMNGNTGPFLQYTHARICSVLRKYENFKAESDKIESSIIENNEITSKAARYVIIKLHEFSDKYYTSIKNYDPSEIAHYLHDLAKTYNHFYQTVPILKENAIDQPETRLYIDICKQTAATIKEGCRLLGIEV